MLPKNTKNNPKPMRMARNPHTSKPTYSNRGKDMSLSAVTKQSNEKQKPTNNQNKITNAKTYSF